MHVKGWGRAKSESEAALKFTPESALKFTPEHSLLHYCYKQMKLVDTNKQYMHADKRERVNLCRKFKRGIKSLQWT